MSKTSVKSVRMSCTLASMTPTALAAKQQAVFDVLYISASKMTLERFVIRLAATVLRRDILVH